MRFRKDPDAVLDYVFDWTVWLGGTDAIASYEITVQEIDGDDAPLTLDSHSDDGQSVTVWLSGGTVDAYYTVACRIVTDDGRTDERTFTVHVKER